MSYQVRNDFRRTHFYITDNIICDVNGKFIKELKGAPFMLYSIILSKQNNTYYVPSLTKISNASGYSKAILIKAMRKLEDLKLINTERRNGSKMMIDILQIPELEEPKKELSEKNILEYIECNYNDFTPRTKKEIYDFITSNGKLNENMPDELKKRIERDRHKLKLVSKTS